MLCSTSSADEDWALRLSVAEVGADGAALSKRLGSLSISDMRDQGYEPIAITSFVLLTTITGVLPLLAYFAGLASTPASLA